MGVSRRERSGPRRESRRRLTVLGLMLLVFGLPGVLAALVLFFQGRYGTLVLEEQPGGVVAGHLATADGAPVAGASVELSVLSRGSSGRPEGSPFERLAATDTNGGFQVTLAPVTGLYVLRAGGGPWRWAQEYVSLVDGPAAPLVLATGPAGVLSARVEKGGAPRGRGKYRLVRVADGPLGALGAVEVFSGEFADGRFERGGLAPGTWSLVVTVEGGLATFESEVVVPEAGGRQELRFAW